ncbi:hypothetical protein SAMN05216588_115107 [Pseudomonas flavescens]|uniref:Uncharacterized protein n=1 Tax=Phytopseudomonas flavescens TaxID=29435 RepID=A0A1G8JZ17_9GAMM|nr:hypothetical protein [Pseudomonas flavescens]SDI36424.1 hypothetical protein SAMN05216588_115107 [Pseudomonas flavescens]
MDHNSVETDVIETSPDVEPLIPFTVEFLDNLTKVAAIATPFIERFAETLSKIDWKKVHRASELLPSRAQATMQRCAEKGWFFSWHMSLANLVKLLSELEQLEDEDIDSYFVEFHRNNFDFLTKSIISATPNREAVLNAAFSALQRANAEDYYLSIPVLLAQADGILAEITKSNSPLQRNAEGAKKWANTITGEISKASIYPIFHIDKYDLLIGGKQREEFEKSGSTFTALNRHQILHGEVWNYGTEVNAFKAFSFLCFVTLQLHSVADKSNLELQ